MGYIARRAERLTPYAAGEQPKGAGFIKLNTNENPYPPSPGVFPAIGEAAKHLPLYPNADAEGLRRAIAESEGLGPDFVYCGNGSDEVISLCFYAFFDERLPLLFPDVTYSFYPVFAQFYGIPAKDIPVDEAFRIRVEDYFQPAGGVIFPNPNAPTGIFLEPAEIRRLLQHHKDCVVAVDEAYIAFGGQSATPLVRDFPNLLVIRTFSKSHALAGMRVGYAIGQPRLIRALTDVKNSFNSYPVDRIAAAAAEAAVRDAAYYAGIDGKIAATRERFRASLAGRGFRVLPSKANFVFASHPDVPAKELFYGLREKGILVRHFDGPRIDDFLRITIGTDEEMDAVAAALAELLRGPAARIAGRVK